MICVLILNIHVRSRLKKEHEALPDRACAHTGNHGNRQLPPQPCDRPRERGSCWRGGTGPRPPSTRPQLHGRRPPGTGFQHLPPQSVSRPQQARAGFGEGGRRRHRGAGWGSGPVTGWRGDHTQDPRRPPARSRALRTHWKCHGARCAVRRRRRAAQQSLRPLGRPAARSGHRPAGCHGDASSTPGRLLRPPAARPCRAARPEPREGGRLPSRGTPRRVGTRPAADARPSLRGANSPVSLSRLRSPPPIDVHRGTACDQQAQLWVASSGGLSMCSARHLSPPTSPAQRAGQGDRGQSLRQVGPQRKDGPAVGCVFCPRTGWRSPAKPSELETPRVPETPAGGPRAQTTPAATRRRPPSSPRLQVGGPRVRCV